MDIRKVLVISLGHLSCDINGGALPTLLPYLAAMHNFDYQTAGGLMFAYSVASSIVQPVFGLLSDKVRTPIFAPLGVLLAGLGIGLCGLLDSYAAIFCRPRPERHRRRALPSGRGPLRQPRFRRTAGHGPQHLSVGGNSGFVAGPLLVTGATYLFGLRGTLAFALLALVMSILLFRLLVGNTPPAGQSATQADAVQGNNDWRAFGILTLVIMSRSILFLGLNSYIPLYWTDVFNVSKADAGLILTFFLRRRGHQQRAGRHAGGQGRLQPGHPARLSRLPAGPAALPADGISLAGGPAAGPAGCRSVRSLQRHGRAGAEVSCPQCGPGFRRHLGPCPQRGRHRHPRAGLCADHYGGLPTAMLCLAPVAIVGGLASCFLRDPAQDDPAAQRRVA